MFHNCPSIEITMLRGFAKTFLHSGQLAADGHITLGCNGSSVKSPLQNKHFLKAVLQDDQRMHKSPSENKHLLKGALQDDKLMDKSTAQNKRRSISS